MVTETPNPQEKQTQETQNDYPFPAYSVVNGIEVVTVPTGFLTHLLKKCDKYNKLLKKQKDLENAKDLDK